MRDLMRLLDEPHSLVMVGAILSFVSGLVLLRMLFIQSFPERPGELLASVSGRGKGAERDAQTAFRTRFRRSFREALEAMRPLPLVVFIDDLDRCEAKKSVEALEAVNFLVSNGPAVVVLGVAFNVLTAQVAQVYRNTAKEQSALGLPPSVDGSGRKLPDEQIRYRYAAGYLRKLVQIRLPVPGGSGIALAAPLHPSNRVEDISRWFWNTGLALLLAVVIGAVAWAAIRAFGQWESVQKDRIEARQKGTRELLRFARQAGVEVTNRIALVEDAIAALPKRTAKTNDIRVASDKMPKGNLPSRDNTARYCTSAEDPWPEAADLPGITCKAGLATHKSQMAEAEALIKQRSSEFVTLADADDNRLSEEYRRRFKEHIEEGLEEARRLSDKVLRVTKPESRPPAAVQKAILPAPAQSTSEPVQDQDEIVVVNWPLWTGLSALGIVLLFAVFRRQRFQITDSKSFEDALAIWCDLIDRDEDARSPREVKRFLNLARYAAARLSTRPRPASLLERLIGKRAASTPPASNTISEPTIVALTAISHVLANGRSLNDYSVVEPSKADAQNEDQHLATILKLQERHVAVFGSAWTPNEVDAFRRVVEEFDEDESNAHGAAPSTIKSPPPQPVPTAGRSPRS